MPEITATATGVSPAFAVSWEEFRLDHFTSVTRIDIDGVQPPLLGQDGGVSTLMELRNLWFPWIDEKLVEPKYDGVCQYMGIASNKPTYVKDYHMISLFRATDRVLAPQYNAVFHAQVDSPRPVPPPAEADQE